jgi:hypothetical protein
MIKLLSPVAWLKFIVRGLIAILAIGGWVVAALAVHVVVVEPPVQEIQPPAEETESVEATAEPADPAWKVIVVPKNRLGLSQTYVDTRDWTPEQAAEHADLLARMAEAGKELHARHLAGEAANDLLRDVFMGRVKGILTE